MYNAKHTPGPWEVFTDPLGKDDYEYGVVVLGQTICRLPWVGPSFTGQPIEANARLIAAAPELLAALYSAKSFIEAHDETHHDGATMGPTYATICAAIAKAKGV